MWPAPSLAKSWAPWSPRNRATGRVAVWLAANLLLTVGWSQNCREQDAAEELCSHLLRERRVIEDTLLEAEEKMDKAIEVAKEEFSAVRTGRANPAMFHKVMVEYYGSPDTVAAAGALLPFRKPAPCSSHPFDKTSMHDIERALSSSEVGANPSNDGNVIRIIMPELTSERRKEYVKIVRTKGEDAKISVRNIRRKAKEQLDKLVKDGDAGEDEGIACREGIGRHDQVPHRQHRRAAQTQGSRASRGLMTDPKSTLAGSDSEPAASNSEAELHAGPDEYQFPTRKARRQAEMTGMIPIIVPKNAVPRVPGRPRLLRLKVLRRRLPLRWCTTWEERRRDRTPASTRRRACREGQGSRKGRASPRLPQRPQLPRLLWQATVRDASRL